MLRVENSITPLLPQSSELPTSCWAKRIPNPNLIASGAASRSPILTVVSTLISTIVSSLPYIFSSRQTQTPSSQNSPTTSTGSTTPTTTNSSSTIEPGETITTPTATSAHDRQQIRSSIGEILGKKSNALVSEEELYFSAIAYKLGEADKNLATSFRKEVEASLLKAGSGYEAATNSALNSLVGRGELTKARASAIRDLCFSASQLDSDKTKLWDSIGSTADKTKAVATLNQGADQLWKTFRGDKGPKVSGQGGNVSQSSGSQEFLWKPKSEKDQKSVVLLPAELTGRIASVKLEAARGKFIESGTFSGVGNENREHFRFSKAGGSYPDGARVVVTLRDGSIVEFKVKETSERFTAKLGEPQ